MYTMSKTNVHTRTLTCLIVNYYRILLQLNKYDSKAWHFLGKEYGLVLENGEAVQATVHREYCCFQALDLEGKLML